jgi:hypothetical protein
MFEVPKSMLSQCEIYSSTRKAMIGTMEINQNHKRNIDLMKNVAKTKVSALKHV